jgi:sugar/nucleoside kinase (ribokinase family)
MNIYEIRKAGKEYCETQGSEHYHTEDVEPIDLIISLGYGEGFCAGSIIKYASRFKKTQKLDDLKKVADYAHILCGMKLPKEDKK